MGDEEVGMSLFWRRSGCGAGLGRRALSKTTLAVLASEVLLLLDIDIEDSRWRMHLKAGVIAVMSCLRAEMVTGWGTGGDGAPYFVVLLAGHLVAVVSQLSHFACFVLLSRG